MQSVHCHRPCLAGGYFVVRDTRLAANPLQRPRRRLRHLRSIQLRNIVAGPHACDQQRAAYFFKLWSCAAEDVSGKGWPWLYTSEQVHHDVDSREALS